jgi:hypothetical protein
MAPGSSPVMQAAAPSSRPAAAPLVTRPDSAPVCRAITADARACSSTMSTQCAMASAIAARTSGRVMPPESRVPGPLALMIGSSPKRA